MKKCTLILLVLTALSTTACKKKSEAPAPAQADKPAPEKTDKPSTSSPPPAASPLADMKPNTSPVPATMNQILVDQAVPDVSLEILSPKDGETLPEGEPVQLKLDLKNYRTGKEIGQHVHVIIDNNPYMADYDPSQPFPIKDLQPGTHILRAFPARHYHLGLKKGDVFKTVVFHVGAPSKDFAFDKTKPYLTYSRPKGTYPAYAAKIGLLLDYYVSNIELGKDAKVVYGVDGQETTQDAWAPVILPPMEPGEHTITLKLVDGNGKVIENGGVNNTTRTIVVK